jgi:hypothetical protein
MIQGSRRLGVNHRGAKKPKVGERRRHQATPPPLDPQKSFSTICGALNLREISGP